MAGLLLHRILGRGPPIAQNGSSRTLRLTPSSPWGVPMKITGNMLGGLLQAGTLIWVGLSSLLIHVWIELNFESGREGGSTYRQACYIQTSFPLCTPTAV